MMSDPLHIHIDLAALQGNFFRRLQHQLDVIKVLQVGCEQVTLKQVRGHKEFGRFVPANGAQLQHEDAKAEALDWLLLAFLRDAIERAGLFLDECLHICEILPVIATGKVKQTELDRLFNALPQQNHRLHFPKKLEKLERDFGVFTRYNANVLSLNKARTCVVHRLGCVTELDVNESGELKVIFQHAKYIARGQVTGQELTLDRPGIITTEDSMLELHFVDNVRTFQVGERVHFQAHELYDTIITLWRFGLALVQSIESYSKTVGIQLVAMDR